MFTIAKLFVAFHVFFLNGDRTMFFLERGLADGYSIFHSHLLYTGNTDAVSYCRKHSNGDSDYQGLTLKNMSFAFVVLTIGYLLALLAFIIENVGFRVPLLLSF